MSVGWRSRGKDTVHEAPVQNAGKYQCLLGQQDPGGIATFRAEDIQVNNDMPGKRKCTIFPLYPTPSP